MRSIEAHNPRGEASIKKFRTRNLLTRPENLILVAGQQCSISVMTVGIVMPSEQCGDTGILIKNAKHWFVSCQVLNSDCSEVGH
jgi:hypothetical protein